MLNQIKLWARGIKRDVVALYFAARDPRTPKFAKVIAILVVGYALSPIDLIPDFIPLLGVIDDIVLVPLGIMLVVKFIPVDLMAEFRTRAIKSGRLPVNKTAAVFIILVWMIMIALVIWWLNSLLAQAK